MSNTSLRGPAILAAAIMCLQQLSGVNAVIFYSTPILKSLLPASAGLIGIGITAVNAIMTLPAIFLVDVSVPRDEGIGLALRRCSPSGGEDCC